MRNLVEIGSEFWIDANTQSSLLSCHYALSGRTAIDLILQDMTVSGKSVNSVYMPAWCCESMMQPFIDRGLDVRFYDISSDKDGFHYVIDANYKTHILYVANYFGYSNMLPDSVVNQLKNHGATIIYDRTHALFRNEDNRPSWGDYTIASIRKWLGVASGAIVYKHDGHLSLPVMKDCDYVSAKWEAMALKAAYLEEVDKRGTAPNVPNIKEVFLKEFETFDHTLSKDYRNYRIDEASLAVWLTTDKTIIQDQRRENAQYVEDAVSKISQIRPMFQLQDNDCPLCVPVLFSCREERDSVRRLLTEKGVYCPVHWPKPDGIPHEFSVNEIYDCELSLLCDQRYTPDDLQRMVDIVKNYFNS